MDPGGQLVGIDPHPPGRLGLSFERAITRRELSRVSGANVELWRMDSNAASTCWSDDIDLLFIDGDHSWDGIDNDWKRWSGWIREDGVVALHDSQPTSIPALDSVRYYREVISCDKRFVEIDVVDSMTVLRRIPNGS